MANPSIYAAFERMWQHLTAAVGTKADVGHKHNDDYDAKGSAQSSLEAANTYTDESISNLELVTIEEVDAICGGTIQYASFESGAF